MPQISRETDEYLPRKKVKQFHTQINLPFNTGSHEKKNLLKILWDESGVKS